MKKVIYACIVLFSVWNIYSSGQQDSLCYDGQCFWITSASTTFEDAAGACAAQSGGILATLDTEAKFNYIVNNVMSSSSVDIRVGATDQGVESVFRWAQNNIVLNYDKWDKSSSQPNGDIQQQCLVIDSNKLYHDRSCDDQNQNLCSTQSALTCTDSKDACSGSRTGLPVVTRLTFQHHQESRTWALAKQDCESDGQRLLSIITLEYQEAFNDLGINTEVWLGLTDETVESTFRWVNDDSVLTWENWKTGSPRGDTSESQAYERKDCVKVVYGGEWMDVPCTYSLPYVCMTLNASVEMTQGHQTTTTTTTSETVTAQRQESTAGSNDDSHAVSDESATLRKATFGLQVQAGRSLRLLGESNVFSTIYCSRVCLTAGPSCSGYKVERISNSGSLPYSCRLVTEISVGNPVEDSALSQNVYLRM